MHVNEPSIIAAKGPAVGAEIQKLPSSWQWLLKDAIRDPAELCALLRLPAGCLPAARRAAGDFPLFVPRGYAAKMRPGNPRDPLLLQVLPVDEECSPPESPAVGAGSPFAPRKHLPSRSETRLWPAADDRPDFVSDPVGDLQAQVAAGMLQKYHGRALLIATGACAIHCRYCFRRHFPYSDGPHSLAAWQPAIERIADDPTIEEVILSGGDPLTLVDPWLKRLVEQLASIAHVRRLRVHSRLPVVLPERVCPEMFEWLCGTRLTPIMVVHANHPAEICAGVAAAFGRLSAAGVIVLNQAVLLRQVNDNADVLAELCRRLVDLRVMPYYLHQLDRVRGASHFEVSQAEGLVLMGELRRRLPGYAVPRYVRESAGAASKIDIGLSHDAGSRT